MESKRIEKIISCKQQPRENWLFVYNIKLIDFKAKKITRSKEKYFITIKISTKQIVILKFSVMFHICVRNNSKIYNAKLNRTKRRNS